MDKLKQIYKKARTKLSDVVAASDRYLGPMPTAMILLSLFLLSVSSVIWLFMPTRQTRGAEIYVDGRQYAATTNLLDTPGMSTDTIRALKRGDCYREYPEKVGKYTLYYARPKDSATCREIVRARKEVAEERRRRRLRMHNLNQF